LARLLLPAETGSVRRAEEAVWMSEFVVGLFVSLDGVVELPEQSILPYLNDEVVEVIRSDQDETDTILLGRRTYQEFAAYWPDKTAAEDPFADHINGTPKLVVSRTLETVEWQTTKLIADGVARDLTKLKRRSGKNISVASSPNLLRSPLAEGLVDELTLLLFPIVSGNGRHLFDDWARRMPMRLAESRALGNGVLSLVYEPGG
jgi:dihydrofolate reductase